jgi:putative peptide maturation system protein
MTTTPPLQPLLAETLTYLQTLARDAIQPTDARAGLRRIEQQYPEHPLDLVWIEESYDASIHYDALIRLPGDGTVSLSFSPDRSLPWPLRGVQRWKDQDLVRVNSNVLTVDHAIACLDFIWGEVAITRRLIDVCLIKEALEREPIVLSDDELQRAMDAFRRARRLYTADATRAWMDERGISYEKLERLVTDDATVARLRQRVAEGRVESYFAEHGDDFASVVVVRLDFSRLEHALQAFDELQQGATFDDVAQRRLVEEPRASLRSAVLPRSEAARLEPVDGAGSIRAGACPIDRTPPADVAEALFAAGQCDVIGPVRIDSEFSLLQVRAALPATLDATTRGAVQRALFDQWLAERRAAADIEWFWGNATSSSAA